MRPYGRSPAPGVAMRHDMPGIAQQVRSELAQLFVRRDIFAVNFLRFIFKKALHGLDALTTVSCIDFTHPLERPKEIDGCRPSLR